MRRKIICMLLSACMLLGALASGGVLAAEEEPAVGDKVFYNRNYNGGAVFSGVDAYPKSNSILAMKDDDGNQYIQIKMSDNPTEDAFFQITIEEPTRYMVFEMDLSKTTDGAGMMWQYKDLAGNSNYLVNVGRDGVVTTHAGGAEIGTIAAGEWNKITAAVDFSENTATYYYNGEPVVENEAFDPSFDSIDFFRAYVGKGDPGGDILIDNFKIYEGTEPREIEPEDRDKMVYTPVNSNPDECGSMLFYNRTYEETDKAWNAGLTVMEKTNKIELAEEDGNHYIAMRKLAGSTDDMLVDINFSSPSRFMVFAYDITVDKPETSFTMWQYKDIDGNTSYVMSLNADGTITYKGNGAVVGSITPGEWTRVELVVDFQTSSADLYINDEMVFEGEPLPNPEYNSIASIRTHQGGGAANDGHSIMIDNYQVYEGKVPREIKEGELPPRMSIMPEDDEAELALINEFDENAVLVNVDAGTIFYDGAKHKLDVAPYYSNDRTLVPLRAISEALGCEVGWDEATKTASINGDTKVTIGETTMQLPGGKTYELDVPAEQTNDRTFLPLRALCEQALGKVVTWDERGLIVLSDAEYAAADETETDTNLRDINNFMLYDRPTAQTITELYNQGAKQHPRVVLTPEKLAQIKADYAAGNTYIKAWGDTVISDADRYLLQSMPEHVLGDGVRLLPVSQTVSERVEALAMAYHLTGNTEYADCAYNNLAAAAAFADWNPSHYLDPTMMAYGFAVGYDWLYDYWTEEQKKVLSDAMYKHCLKITDEIYYGQSEYSNFWAKVEHNWNPHCNGYNAIAAIALFDVYPELAADTVSKAVRGFEYVLNSFYPDGAWMEGTGYWNGTISPIAETLSTLQNTFGTDFNLSKAPALGKTVYFPMHAQGPQGTNNYHDSGAVYMNVPATFWCANQYQLPDVTKIRLYQMDKLMLPGTVYDMIWYDTSITDQSLSLPKDMYFKGVELVSMRNAWDNDAGAFLSYHAGASNVNHSHLDTGTFVLDMLGQRFALDIGSEDYNLDGMYGTKRFWYYRNRPEGHNLYVINPDQQKDQGQAENTFCEVEVLESSPRGAYSIADLTPAYQNYATQARRGYKLEDDRRTAVIRDEISLRDDNSEIYWFVHTTADIEVVDNSTAIMTLNNQQVKVVFNTNADSQELSVMDAVALPSSPVVTGEKSRDGIRKIALKLNASGDVYIQAKFIPVDGVLSEQPVQDIPLDQWKNAEGEFRALPTLDMIYVDGEPMADFSASTTAYTLRFPYNQTAIPQITATAADNIDIKIDQAQSVTGFTNLHVSYKDMPDLVNVYVVNQQLMPKLEDVGGMTRYQVFSTLASDNPEEENMHYNVADNDINTRWACSGNDCWVQIDLGESKPIDAVGASMMSGDARVYTFSIAVSEDGQNWTQVLDHAQSSGTTNEIEIYRLPERVNARYVRYIGYCNSVNEWNSITEVAALCDK